MAGTGQTDLARDRLQLALHVPRKPDTHHRLGSAVSYIVNTVLRSSPVDGGYLLPELADHFSSPEDGSALGTDISPTSFNLVCSFAKNSAR